MKVTSSASMNGQGFEVELDEQDMLLQVSEDVWRASSLTRRHSMMMKVADLLIVRYMKDAGLISSEYAETRYAEIARRQAS